MIFDLRTLTDAEHYECKRIGFLRASEQITDAKNGDSRALNSYGSNSSLNIRTDAERLLHAWIGAIAEEVNSKVAKCDWTKESGQYKGNKKPDLTVIYRGKRTACESRGSQWINDVIYRPSHDNHRPEVMLMAVTNLPYGPICQVGHIFLGDFRKIAESHPERYYGENTDCPYYRIPIKFLLQDFSEFGE